MAEKAMKRLPYDYSRCIPLINGCEAKQQCARYTSKWRETMQSCADFSWNTDGDKCSEFIYNKRDTK